jgi:hypothetical protein
MHDARGQNRVLFGIVRDTLYQNVDAPFYDHF